MIQCAQLMMTLQRSAHAVTVTMAGELDVAVVSDVRDTMRDLVVEDESVASVCLDVTNVTFVDSTGLHILTQAHRTAVEHGLDFTVVAAPRSAVVQLIQLCASENWFGRPQPDLVGVVTSGGGNLDRACRRLRDL